MVKYIHVVADKYCGTFMRLVSYILITIFAYSLSISSHAEGHDNWKLLSGSSGTNIFKTCHGVGESGVNPTDSISAQINAVNTYSLFSQNNRKSVANKAEISKLLQVEMSRGTIQNNRKELSDESYNRRLKQYQENLRAVKNEIYTLSLVAETQSKMMANKIFKAINKCQIKIYVDQQLIHNSVEKLKISQGAEGATEAISSFPSDSIAKGIDTIVANKSYSSIIGAMDEIEGIVRDESTTGASSLSITSLTKASLSCEKALASAYTILNIDVNSLSYPGINDGELVVERKLESALKAMSIVSSGCKTMDEFGIPPSREFSETCRDWLEKAINSYQVCENNIPLDKDSVKENPNTDQNLLGEYIKSVSGMNNYVNEYGVKSNAVSRSFFASNNSKVIESYIDELDRDLKSLEREREVISSSNIFDYLKIKTIKLIQELFLVVESSYAAISKVGTPIFGRGVKVPCFGVQLDSGCSSVLSKYEQYNELYEEDHKSAKINLLVGKLADAIQGESRYSPDAVKYMDEITAQHNYIKRRRDAVTEEFYSLFYNGDLPYKDLERLQFQKFKEEGLQFILGTKVRSNYRGIVSRIRRDNIGQSDNGVGHINSRKIANVNSRSEQNHINNVSSEYDIDVIHKNRHNSIFKIISLRYVKKRVLWK